MWKKIMPMQKDIAKEIRNYVGALGIFIVVIGLLFFLSFHQIPTENKDLFVSIVGVISGSLSVTRRDAH
jgi:hypothetical protein